MEESPNNLSTVLEEIAALKELVNTIIDYYCFKHNEIDDDKDEEEGDEWKRNMGKKFGFDSASSENVIPEEIDEMISEAFKNQLKRFH